MLMTLCLSGSRGDIQPGIALAKRLISADFGVRVAAAPNYRGFIESHGIEFHALGIDFEEVMRWDVTQRAIESGSDAREYVSRIYEGLDPLVDDITRQLLSLCEGSDLILGSGLTFPGAYNVGEKLNIPVMSATLQPLFPTRFLPVGFGLARGTGPFWNTLAWIRLGLWAAKASRPSFKRARSEVLGLPRADFGAPYMTSVKRGDLTLYAFSPTVVPKPRDWPSTIDVTGYWFLEDEEPGWQPPPALVDFIASGTKPVYVGFGSVVSRHAERNLHTVIAALRKSGRRGILNKGWGGLAAESGPLDDDFYVVESIPHSWLLPQMGAVVHHGGAGTTASGLRAGIPSLIVPFYGDHFFWGSRIVHLGVGPSPIPHAALDIDNLSSAIDRMTSDTGMSRRASDIGVRIRSEDGPSVAVTKIIERFGGVE